MRLPNGFAWKTAQAVRTAAMRIFSPSLNFDYSGKNGYFSVVEFSGL